MGDYEESVLRDTGISSRSRARGWDIARSEFAINRARDNIFALYLAYYILTGSRFDRSTRNQMAV